MTPELARKFASDGFVVLPQALPDTVIAEYEHLVLSLLREGFTEVLHKEPLNPLDGNRCEDLEVLFAAAGTSAAALSSWLYTRLLDYGQGQKMLELLNPEALASDFLGDRADAYYLRRESTVTRVDLPGPSPIRLGWHQEVRYDPTRSAGIQFWLPLFQPSSWENGSFEIAVGSHVVGILEVPLANPKGVGAQQYLVGDDVVNKYPHHLVEISPGDVAVLNCQTLHRSSDPERQNRVKVSHVGRCLLRPK